MGALTRLMGKGDSKGNASPNYSGAKGGDSPLSEIRKNIGKLRSKKSDASDSDTGAMEAMHSGGKVRKTKAYRLRKGEQVLTKGQQRKAGLLKSRGKSRSKKRR